ncbi:MAG: dTDP-4-dehydrorhamnose 3,5-epimerase, partial [Methanolinea sp.]|nr:dTDP-4-dehydrorhamnose 3,5-epimerase [Methanolinea sp.]
LQPRIFRDSRGFFLETYTHKDFSTIGIPDEFVQDNHSCSVKGVLRGLHYQSRHPQGKLVRVVRGSIYDVVVDLRKGSPSWKQWIAITLASDDPRFLWVPPGLAHGFLSLEDHTEVLYKTTEYYHPEYDAGIRWNDPELSISWPLSEFGIPAPLVSPKDSALPLLKEFESPFSYPGGD